jgi:hypothetical protein
MFYGSDNNEDDPRQGGSPKQSAIVGIDGFIIGGISRSKAEPGLEEELDMEVYMCTCNYIYKFIYL